jgi:hypothetical protein
MAEFPDPVGRREGAEEEHPPSVKGVQQGERNFNRRGASVLELGPPLLEVGLDGGCVFGQGQLDPSISVEVTVREVVYDLANAPPSRPVRCGKLIGTETVDGRTEPGGSLGDIVYPGKPSLVIQLRRQIELPDGITQIGHDPSSAAPFYY